MADFSGDQVTWSEDARRKQHEDTLCAWLSLDEVASYEEDARLKTEEEEDEREELPGMSSASANKLQILWDHFIHAEPQSYEVPIFFRLISFASFAGQNYLSIYACTDAGINHFAGFNNAPRSPS